MSEYLTESLVVWHHSIYLGLSILVTVVVGQILFRSGRVFLEEAFPKKELLAEAINRLLLVGFYLINIGWLGFTLKTNLPLVTTSDLIERVASGLGRVLLILGVMHFINVYLLNAYRRKALDQGPVSPGEYFSPKES